MHYDKPLLTIVGRAKGIVLGYFNFLDWPDSFKDSPVAPNPGQWMGSRDGPFPPDDRGAE